MRLVWPLTRFQYLHLRWAVPYTTRVLLRLPPRWRDAIVAEFTRRVFAAWGKLDLRTLLAVFHDDWFLDNSGWAEWPDQATYRGREGIRRFFSDWGSVWREYTFTPTHFVALDRQKYFWAVQFSGRGARSGIEVDRPFFQIAEGYDGFPARLANYTDEAEALEAAGLTR